jgi:pyruvate dehydrogenase E2 component (dihydrolipoamide acetyltransferase)
MQIIRLPRLGQTMETGIMTLWCLAEGDQFATGDPLYEVETEKMTSEVEAKQDGVLVRILVPAGDEAGVGAVLGVMAALGEAVSDAEVDAFVAEIHFAIEPDDENEAPAQPERSQPQLSEPEPQQPQSQLVEREAAPVPEAAAGREPEPSRTDRVLAVPRAREVAKQLDVDLAAVRGSGVGGVVRVDDVRSAAGRPTARGGYEGSPRVAQRIPVRGVARSMAEAVTRSWREVPQFVQQVSLDATALVARLKRLRYEGLAVTYTDLLISAVAATARDAPDINATFTPEEIIRYADVNVSFAVATDRGLVVPVVRQAHELSVAEIADRTKELAGRARDGRLTAADTTDGTITVSNLGAFGVDTGTPIVNAPQSAIVFVGSLGDRAVVVNGQIAIRTMLNVAIGYDHRVVDGMAGAMFTSALKARLEAGG